MDILCKPGIPLELGGVDRRTRLSQQVGEKLAGTRRASSHSPERRRHARRGLPSLEQRRRGPTIVPGVSVRVRRYDATVRTGGDEEEEDQPATPHHTPPLVSGMLPDATRSAATATSPDGYRLGAWRIATTPSGPNNIPRRCSHETSRGERVPQGAVGSKVRQAP